MAHQKKEYPADSVVEKAINIVGGVSELVFKLNSSMAEELAITGKGKINRQMMHLWRSTCRFPGRIIPHIHKITRIPMGELVAAYTPKAVKDQKDNPENKSDE